MENLSKSELLAWLAGRGRSRRSSRRARSPTPEAAEVFQPSDQDAIERGRARLDLRVCGGTARMPDRNPRDGRMGKPEV